MSSHDPKVQSSGNTSPLVLFFMTTLADIRWTLAEYFYDPLCLLWCLYLLHLCSRAALVKLLGVGPPSYRLALKISTFEALFQIEI